MWQGQWQALLAHRPCPPVTHSIVRAAGSPTAALSPADG